MLRGLDVVGESALPSSMGAAGAARGGGGAAAVATRGGDGTQRRRTFLPVSRSAVCRHLTISTTSCDRMPRRPSRDRRAATCAGSNGRLPSTPGRLRPHTVVTDVTDVTGVTDVTDVSVVAVVTGVTDVTDVTGGRVASTPNMSHRHNTRAGGRVARARGWVVCHAADALVAI